MNIIYNTPSIIVKSIKVMVNIKSRPGNMVMTFS